MTISRRRSAKRTQPGRGDTVASSMSRKASDFGPNDLVKAKPWWRGPYAHYTGRVRSVEGTIIRVAYEGDPVPDRRRFEAHELDLIRKADQP